ncbi:hypothetical protein CDV26_02620 [Francisella halioticida]|uniref:Uncharacterized protein n=1 Tax=Francisella halioticida TaxID=549298 RepID=A0ABM6LXQ4_9GAMM|nr:hypothetical protein [Francisella halioticida]ASG67436.1 hypothetical protein CDV26_02620 [Francisella halioticida]
MVKLFICFLFVLGANQAWALVGELSIQNGEFFLTSKNKKFNLQGDKKIIKESESLIHLDSLVVVNNYVKVDENTLYLKEVPSSISGSIQFSGKLIRDQKSLYLDTTDDKIPIKLLYGVDFRGNHFDQKSINYYINKQVNIIGKFYGGYLHISAILLSNIFENIDAKFPINSKYKKSLDKNYQKFITETLMENEFSQNLQPFKVTIVNNAKVKNNDKALLISLAGRQGDDFATVGGHFVLGEATLDNNMLKNFSLFNFYTTKNKKMMIPAEISYVDYFGNLSQGQQNYRSTYTLIIYGVDKDKIKKMANVINRDLNYMRISQDTGGIFYDCVNTALYALYRSQFIDNPSSLSFLGLQTFYRTPKKYDSSNYSYFNNSWYYILNSKKVFLPRAGFKYILENIREFKPKRVDFVFYNQIPSGRPLGGAPIASIYNYLRITARSDKPSKKYTVYDMAKFLDILDI